jgi:hypothetical protein
MGAQSKICQWFEKENTLNCTLYGKIHKCKTRNHLSVFLIPVTSFLIYVTVTQNT